MSDIFEPERIVVTGGCVFIGSNFDHHVERQHPGVHVTAPGAPVSSAPTSSATSWSTPTLASPSSTS